MRKKAVVVGALGVVGRYIVESNAPSAPCRNNSEKQLKNILIETLEARTVPIDGFVSLARAGSRRVLGIGCRSFFICFKFQNSLVTKGQIQRSFSNSPMKKPSPANGG